MLLCRTDTEHNVAVV